MNALVLAAGMGTRLGELTADRPKALVEVAGHTMLEHQIRRLKSAGFSRIAVNVHHFADKIISYLNANGNFGADIVISDERDLLLDTGGGIRKAFHLFQDDAPMLVHNVDIFSMTDLRTLYTSHLESRADITLLTADRRTSRYLHFDDKLRLRGWSNGKTGEIRSPFADFDESRCTPLAFQGIHILSRSVLPVLDSVSAERFSITDFYVDNAAALNIRTVCEDPKDWVDAGKPDALDYATKIALKSMG